MDLSHQHPSLLALERHALGVAAPEVAAHVAGCEACRARLPASPPAAAVPAWARQLPPRRRPWFLRAFGTRPRAFGVAVAALACAVLVWAGRDKLDGDQAYVGAKGGPELWLYVKRGERIALWNGTDPVMSGDLLRLKIQPDRFKHVTILGATRPRGEYSRLYDGAIAGGEPTALPFSLKVDAQPGDEALVVVLGSAPVAPDQVDKVLGGDADKEGRWWSRRLVLSKALPQRDGAPP